MSGVGARERRRHAIAFAAWCSETGMQPMAARRRDVEDFLAVEAGGDRKKAAKIRCSLRAVARAIDPEQSARMLGLGAQTNVFEGLSEPLSQLIEATVQQQVGRRAIRLSALRRLFVWAREVDAPPESLTAVDMAQFRAWLLELGLHPSETLVVARDFVELRWSNLGSQLLGRAPRSATRLQPEPPMSRRFE